MTMSRAHRGRLGAAAFTLLACVIAAAIPGCAGANLLGGMAQNFEYQKKIEVPAAYPYLENQRIAVIVDADLGTQFEHPDFITKVTSGLALRINRDVPGSRVLPPDVVLQWQYKTPQWNAMPFGQLAEELEVDRVVYVDVFEYRLHPPGNRWLWEGVCAANIYVIEADAPDPDLYEQFNTIAEFPTATAVDYNSATKDQIETGVLSEFIKKTAWLFHDHIEPKYPDRYRPELDT